MSNKEISIIQYLAETVVSAYPLERFEGLVNRFPPGSSDYEIVVAKLREILKEINQHPSNKLKILEKHYTNLIYKHPIEPARIVAIAIKSILIKKQLWAIEN